MNPPRGLNAQEQEAWARLAQSVTPLPGRKAPPKPAGGTSDKIPEHLGAQKKQAGNQSRPVGGRLEPAKTARPVPTPAPATKPPRRAFANQLDSHWNRKLKAGQIAPDYTLDLHGHTLDAAYGRIISGLDQARAMGARLVLVVAGRERPVDPADRSERRGAIRAKLLDWLAASHHADMIAAVRRAHIRHGGEGALYLVLKRDR